jgi:hypothetical protein
MARTVPRALREAPALDPAARVTGPLVHWTRRRHVEFRRRLEHRSGPQPVVAASVVSAGV